MDTKEKRDVIGEIVFDALFIAILWVPLMFYDVYLSYASGLFVAVFLIPVICCVAMTALFVSETVVQVLAKGGLVSLIAGATLSGSEENFISEFRKKRMIQNCKIAAIVLGLAVTAIVGHCLVTWPEYVIIYGS